MHFCGFKCEETHLGTGTPKLKTKTHLQPRCAGWAPVAKSVTYEYFRNSEFRSWSKYRHQLDGFLSLHCHCQQCTRIRGWRAQCAGKIIGAKCNALVFVVQEPSVRTTGLSPGNWRTELVLSTSVFRLRTWLSLVVQLAIRDLGTWFSFVANKQTDKKHVAERRQTSAKIPLFFGKERFEKFTIAWGCSVRFVPNKQRFCSFVVLTQRGIFNLHRMCLSLIRHKLYNSFSFCMMKYFCAVHGWQIPEMFCIAMYSWVSRAVERCRFWSRWVREKGSTDISTWTMKLWNRRCLCSSENRKRVLAGRLHKTLQSLTLLPAQASWNCSTDKCSPRIGMFSDQANCRRGLTLGENEATCAACFVRCPIPTEISQTYSHREGQSKRALEEWTQQFVWTENVSVPSTASVCWDGLVPCVLQELVESCAFASWITNTKGSILLVLPETPVISAQHPLLLCNLAKSLTYFGPLCHTQSATLCNAKPPPTDVSVSSFSFRWRGMGGRGNWCHRRSTAYTSCVQNCSSWSDPEPRRRDPRRSVWMNKNNDVDCKFCLDIWATMKWLSFHTSWPQKPDEEADPPLAREKIGPFIVKYTLRRRIQQERQTQMAVNSHTLLVFELSHHKCSGCFVSAATF